MTTTTETNRGRDDTVRSIVTSLTDETDLSEELVLGEAQPIVIDQEGEGEESDYEGDDWQPDPIDADPCLLLSIFLPLSLLSSW